MRVASTKHISLMQPYIPPGAMEGVGRTLLSRWIGQGPRVEEFERAFSRQIVAGRSSVAVGSCTDALHLAYILAGIGRGDEVIAPLFTCTATNIPLLYQGARIRFCDVEPHSLNMSVEHAKRLITNRTKAVVVVHYGGMPVDPEFFNLGIPVIEDCAQALGAPVGQRGDFACYSFQAVKHVTTGDGGMLVLPEELTAEAKHIRWFGIDREAKFKGIWANDIDEVGYKYQMTDIAAAMGLAGLEGLPNQIEKRRALRLKYMLELAGQEAIQVIDQHIYSSCWLMTVLVERREDLRRKLIANGVESDQVHYRNDRYSIFKDFRRSRSLWRRLWDKTADWYRGRATRGEFPNMDAIDRKYLVLPLHMGMTVEDVGRICEVIRGGW